MQSLFFLCVAAFDHRSLKTTTFFCCLQLVCTWTWGWLDLQGGAGVVCRLYRLLGVERFAREPAPAPATPYGLGTRRSLAEYEVGGLPHFGILGCCWNFGCC